MRGTAIVNVLAINGDIFHASRLWELSMRQEPNIARWRRGKKKKY
jgi:hypothetical protein